MGLIQAGFLIALFALAIPVLVHLLSRWQVQRVEFGTMQFLQEVIHDSAHRRWIRRWLLLATRMLLLAVLALLFARPFLPERSNRDGGRVRIVLIDRSASMTMPGKSGRLIDDAIAEATAAVDAAGQDVQVQWAWFDRNVEALPESTTRPKPPRTTAGDTNYFAALKWARDRLAAREYSDAEVILATDFQQSGLSAEVADASEISFPADVPVRIIDVGRTAANNVAIVSINSGTSQVPPSKPVVVAATVFNYGALAAEELPITATASNAKRSVRLKKTLNIPGDQAQEVTFDFGKLEAARWQITIDIDVDDDLANDNRRITAIQVASPVKTLVIDPGSKIDGSRSVSYFLSAALQQGVASEVISEQTKAESTAAEAVGVSDREIGSRLMQRRFATEVLYLEDESSISIAKRPESLIIVADAGAVPQRMIDELAKYTQVGGRLLVFAGSRLSNAVADQWSACQLAPGKLLQTENSIAMPFRIVQIASDGSMLEPFRDPQNGDLTRLAFRSMQKTQLNSKTRVVAWFDQQRPAITEHDFGLGKVTWFLSNADGEVSNWTTSPLYLPLVQQMASDLLGMSGEGQIRMRSVGDVFNANPNTPNATQVTAGVAQADNSLGSLYFEQPGFQTAGDVVYVVNTPAKESETAKTSPEAFVKQFGITLANEDGKYDSKQIEAAKKHELWPWLAAALVILLVLEFSLSNRTPA